MAGLTDDRLAIALNSAFYGRRTRPIVETPHQGQENQKDKKDGNDHPN